LTWRKAIIKAKTITLAMLVVAKKVKKSVSGFRAGTDEVINPKVPEPIR
jgi:hypothetical protein